MPYYSTPARFKGKTDRGRNKQYERIIQQNVTNFIRRELPHVKDFYNDWAAGKWFDDKKLGADRKRLSSGRGWADLFIPYPMTHTLTRTLEDGTTEKYEHTFHGMFIEIKRDDVSVYVTKGERKGELIKNEQIEIEADFLKRMNSLGYFARFGIGYKGCVKLLRYYFKMPDDDSPF